MITWLLQHHHLRHPKHHLIKTVLAWEMESLVIRHEIWSLQEWGILNKSLRTIECAGMGHLALMAVRQATCTNGGFCTNYYWAGYLQEWQFTQIIHNMQEWGSSHKSQFACMGHFTQITIWYAIFWNGAFRTNYAQCAGMGDFAQITVWKAICSCL